MSSMFGREGGGSIAPSNPTTVINKLLDGENFPYKTEITNSLAMSFLDLLGVDNGGTILKGGKVNLKDRNLEELNAGDYIEIVAMQYRINQISKRRKSRSEVVEALKTQAQEENSTNAFRKLMGMR